SAISQVLASAVLAVALAVSPAAQSSAPLPELTTPVNDFARVVDAQSAAQMDAIIRELQEKTGDVVAVATVETVEPFGTPKEYAVKLVENHSREIGPSFTAGRFGEGLLDGTNRIASRIAQARGVTLTGVRLQPRSRTPES